MSKPATPRNLGRKASKFWRDVTGEYQLRVDELLLLEDACREIELIEQLEAAQAEEALIATGSMGQPVAAPLIQELRQHRVVLARLLAQLKLPDEGGSDSGSASAKARAAANARWQRGA